MATTTDKLRGAADEVDALDGESIYSGRPVVAAVIIRQAADAFEALERAHARALDALGAIQWGGGIACSCPECHGRDPDDGGEGHFRGCTVGAALGGPGTHRLLGVSLERLAEALRKDEVAFGGQPCACDERDQAGEGE